MINSDNMDKLAESITAEQGKTLPDARGDVFRGLEVVEQTCSTATTMMGETLENLATGLDTYSYKQPLGVCAGVCPFNFPAMIPLWMFPVATACGNTYILKPSEKDPGAAMMLAELAQQAGLPDGVLNIIHGAHDAVNFICDAPDIKAISFVGGNNAGQYIHERGSKNGKRVQANLGAKNHATIMPDADREAVRNILWDNFFPLKSNGNSKDLTCDYLLFGSLFSLQNRLSTLLSVLHSVLPASGAWHCPWLSS